MLFRELAPSQSREFIDAAQAFEALMSTEQRRLQYVGGMHWKSVGDREYLYRTTGGRGRARSLGPRSEEAEATYADFHRGKADLEERYKAQMAAVQERARFCKAAKINRVPRVVTAILRELELRGLLGSGLSVVGTNALYAYEAAAGCQFESSLLATADMDLLWDARTKLQLSGNRARVAEGLIDILRRADRSFDPIKKDSFRAANKDGYLVDLIKPMPQPPCEEQPRKLVDSDELVAAEIANLEWLQSSSRLTQVVIGDDGIPATMVVPDPRLCSLQNLAERAATTRGSQTCSRSAASAGRGKTRCRPSAAFVVQQPRTKVIPGGSRRSEPPTPAGNQVGRREVMSSTSARCGRRLFSFSIMSER